MVLLRPRPQLEIVAVTVTVVGLVLAPFATVALTYRRALHVQAFTLLGLTLGLFVVAFVRPGWKGRIRAFRGRVAVGVGLYAAAALWGAAVGLLRGNVPTLLAGQLLSMGLLPLAAVAGASLRGGVRIRPLAWGLGGGVALASLLQWVAWLTMPESSGELDQRLFLPNSVSAVGASLLGVLCLLALIASEGPRSRLVAFLATIPIILLILASGVRGLWVATVLALLVFVPLALSLRRWRRLVASSWLVAAGLIVAGSLLAFWIARPGPNLLPADTPVGLLVLPSSGPAPVSAGGPASGAVRFSAVGGSCNWALGPPFASGRLQPGTYRLEGHLTGPREWGVYVALQWFDAEGRMVGRMLARRSEGNLAELVSVVPDGVESMRVVVGCPANSDGEWELTDLALRRLGPPLLSRFPPLTRSFRSRLASVADLLTGDLDAVTSLEVRVQESERLLKLFREASWVGKLGGHGLGATYEFETLGRDRMGRPRSDPRPNYIHDFYLFLLYKLGVVGSVSVFAALVLWTAVSLAVARRRPDDLARPFAAAVAAGLLGYGVWSLTSPEILDFRMAPLWGLFLAALMGLEQGREEGREPRGEGGFAGRAPFRPPR